MRWTESLILAVPLLSAHGCGPDTNSNPCIEDPFDCNNDLDDLPSDPECTLSGPIEVELGWGEDGFHAFSEPPEVHYGAQGGSHIFHAVRIRGAEVDDVPMVRVTLRNFDAMDLDACASAIENARQWNREDLPPELLDGPFDAGPNNPVFVVNGDEEARLQPMGPSRCLMQGDSRVLVFGRDTALRLDGEGRIAADGILLQLGWGSTANVTFEASVTDPCGRTGYVNHPVQLSR